MATPEEIKKELERLSGTELAEYLLDSKAQQVIEKKWKVFRWYAGGIVSIFVIILGFYGYQVHDVTSQYKEQLKVLQQDKEQLTNQLTIKTENIKSKIDSIDNRLAAQNGAIIFQEKQLGLQDQTIAQSLNFSNLYSDLFKDQLQQTIQLRSNTENDIAKFAQLEKSIDSTSNVYSKQYEQLNSLRESFKNQIANIEKQNDRNTLNASIRYVYAERSDRNKETFINAYKPSTIVLPNNLDTITFIFYSAVKKGRANKTALIDVYIGKNKNDRSPIEINETNGVLNPTKIVLQTRNENYIIEPVFLYFPPNIGGALIIPDFVVLKVRLRDQND